MTWEMLWTELITPEVFYIGKAEFVISPIGLLIAMVITFAVILVLMPGTAKETK